MLAGTESALVAESEGGHVAKKGEIKKNLKALAAKKVRPAEERRVKGGFPVGPPQIPPGPNVMPVGPPQKAQ